MDRIKINLCQHIYDLYIFHFQSFKAWWWDKKRNYQLKKNIESLQETGTEKYPRSAINDIPTLWFIQTYYNRVNKNINSNCKICNHCNVNVIWEAKYFNFILVVSIMRRWRYLFTNIYNCILNKQISMHNLLCLPICSSYWLFVFVPLKIL